MDKKTVDHYKQKLGAKGEALARDMYKIKGYRVVARNFKCRIGEIDLILIKDNVLVFCEVKTRTRLAFGMPAEAINEKKKQHLRRSAASYLSQGMRLNRLYKDFDMRFDVVEVIFVGEKWEVNHMENAFEGSGAI